MVPWSAPLRSRRGSVSPCPPSHRIPNRVGETMAGGTLRGVAGVSSPAIERLLKAPHHFAPAVSLLSGDRVAWASAERRAC
jgi:hypothetical protein